MHLLQLSLITAAAMPTSWRASLSRSSLCAAVARAAAGVYSSSTCRRLRSCASSPSHQTGSCRHPPYDRCHQAAPGGGWGSTRPHRPRRVSWLLLLLLHLGPRWLPSCGLLLVQVVQLQLQMLCVECKPRTGQVLLAWQQWEGKRVRAALQEG